MPPFLPRACLPALLVLLAACAAPQLPEDEAPLPTETAADGSCWAREHVPAIYEQVSGEVLVVQAEIAEDGTVLRAPIYRRTKVPKLVRPRGEMRFEAPCSAQMTPEFIASVQRALAARGEFSGTVTGEMDGATRAAVRRYQAARGLDSAQLSLETARALGLVAVDLSEITDSPA
ncbi:peptidoglycan-binding domain-containing protein [Alloyangia pacifica]|uniref:Putative peptidoglycan binding domain-containing protein n=1 Tax=Alloyangia pacifica TaxID=311180 RepID=A0A1I6W1V9_9RHOB|nr:peptidoglycan-binding domain-containing protein [Alloyangia pacifica]SDI37829.1 Putative peptidoglycan binding domain-containing protein [Alloyangia pacifica]SFT19968.1 Putative peptidoglycan binding domain-containing protein [Alloyangia pacifica]